MPHLPPNDMRMNPPSLRFVAPPIIRGVVTRSMLILEVPGVGSIHPTLIPSRCVEWVSHDRQHNVSTDLSCDGMDADASFAAEDQRSYNVSSVHRPELSLQRTLPPVDPGLPWTLRISTAFLHVLITRSTSQSGFSARRADLPTIVIRSTMFTRCPSLLLTTTLTF